MEGPSPQSLTTPTANTESTARWRPSWPQTTATTWSRRPPRPRRRRFTSNRRKEGASSTSKTFRPTRLSFHFRPTGRPLWMTLSLGKDPRVPHAEAKWQSSTTSRPGGTRPRPLRQLSIGLPSLCHPDRRTVTTPQSISLSVCQLWWQPEATTQLLPHLNKRRWMLKMKRQWRFWLTYEQVHLSVKKKALRERNFLSFYFKYKTIDNQTVHTQKPRCVTSVWRDQKAYMYNYIKSPPISEDRVMIIFKRSLGYCNDTCHKLPFLQANILSLTFYSIM